MGKYVFGVDLGGTTVKMGLFDTDGNVQDKWEIPTRKQDAGKLILPDIAEAIKNKMAEKNIEASDVTGVGIGVPGPVDGAGMIYKAPNLGWGVFSIKDTLSELLGGMIVEAGNDANVAALGEMWRGGGKGYSSLVMVTLGTGVGGGIIINGKILTGSTGAAGEIGHLPLVEGETESCNCGKKGCLEQYASATGIVRLANRALQTSDKPSKLREVKYISAKEIFDAAKNGDNLALDLVEEHGRRLGLALSNVAEVIDPEVFVIGGGVSRAGEILINATKKYYQQYAFHACKNTKFELATLGNDAGMYGGAASAL